MYKVSFKGNFKTIIRKDRTTIVDLIGEVDFPKGFSENITPETFDWAASNDYVISNNYVRFRGKAVRHPDDEDNPTLGERIAEARAKISLYRFMYNLLKKVYIHYCEVAFGIDDFYPAHVKKDSLYGAIEKYQKLWILESHHLGVLLQ